MPHASREARHEDGFSMIELMMVVLVIAVLLAIAIPTYFGTRQRASDRAVQSNVRNALTAARVFYNAEQRYTSDASVMTAAEPSLSWTTTDLDSTAPPRAVRLQVFDVPTTDQTIVVGGRTPEGRCFFLKDTMGSALGGVYYDFRAPPSGSCAPPDPADPAWAGKWGS